MINSFFVPSPPNRHRRWWRRTRLAPLFHRCSVRHVLRARDCPALRERPVGGRNAGGGAAISNCCSVLSGQHPKERECQHLRRLSHRGSALVTPSGATEWSDAALSPLPVSPLLRSLQVWGSNRQFCANTQPLI